MNSYHAPIRIAFALAATSLITFAPALGLFVAGAGSSLLYALMFVFVAGLIVTPDLRHSLCAYRPWRALTATVISLMVCMLIAQCLHGQWHASSFEKTIRILCVVPMVLLFTALPAVVLRHVQWGFMAGTLAGASALVFPGAVFLAPDGSSRPDTASFTLYNTVGFANLAMLFTALTVASLGWQLTRYPRIERALKIVVAVIGLYGVLMSQTRTSWLALPVFLIIAFIAHSRTSWRKTLLLAVGTITLLIILSSSSVVKDRLNLAVQETEQCADQPNTESSVCIRFQLLRAAGTMFKESPIYGAGDGKQFKQEMHELANRGVISKFVANNWGETHNDLSFVAATYGLLGLIPFLLAMYGVPAWYFVSRLRQRDMVRVTASTMGLVLVLGFLAFGLTEMMFRSMRTVSIYIVFLALFLALSAPPQPQQEPKE